MENQGTYPGTLLRWKIVIQNVTDKCWVTLSYEK